MLSVVEKVIFLQRVNVFTDVPTEDLAFLGAITEEVSYQKGETIYKEHDPSDSLYLVRTGAIRLHQGGKEITTARADEAFGTWALFDEVPRVVDATADEDSQLLRIRRDDFYDLLSDHIQITQGVFKSLVHRLRNLVNRTGFDQVSDNLEED